MSTKGTNSKNPVYKFHEHEYVLGTVKNASGIPVEEKLVAYCKTCGTIK